MCIPICTVLAPERGLVNGLRVVGRTGGSACHVLKRPMSGERESGSRESSEVVAEVLKVPEWEKDLGNVRKLHCAGGGALQDCEWNQFRLAPEAQGVSTVT